jgi:hypothetical protein
MTDCLLNQNNIDHAGNCVWTKIIWFFRAKFNQTFVSLILWNKNEIYK